MIRDIRRGAGAGRRRAARRVHHPLLIPCISNPIDPVPTVFLAVFASSFFLPDRALIAMKSFTIALATAKEAIRQPAFFVLAAIAGFWLIASIFVAYFTFGEDIKMYKDTGLTTISFACLLLALLTASSTVAEEIDGKTAITLLSKPINRRQFIVGKFLGIEMGVLAMFAVPGRPVRAGGGLQVLVRPPGVGRDRRRAAGSCSRSCRSCPAWRWGSSR